MVNHSEENEGGGAVLFHMSMALMLIGVCFPFLMRQEYVLKFRGVPIFRGLVTIAAIIGLIWAFTWEVLDWVVYFVIIAAINIGHMAMIGALQPSSLLDMICVRWKSIHMNKLITKLYLGKIGGPNAIDRGMFCRLTENRAILQKVKKGQYYMKQGTNTKSLSILLEGKMHLMESVNSADDGPGLPVASRVDRFAGVIYPFDFINHLEWIARQCCSEPISRARISALATEDCVVLEWQREFLQETCKQFPQLGACVTSLLGKELALKAALIAGSARDQPSTEFVHHVYCACSFGLDSGMTDQDFLVQAHQKDPEYPWEAAAVPFMSQNNSYRTIKLKPEQWLLRFGAGDGPWVDLPSDGLIQGLVELYNDVTQTPVSANNEKEKQVAARFLSISLNGTTVAQAIQDRLASGDNSKISSSGPDIGSMPWVQLFAIIATANVDSSVGCDDDAFRSLNRCRGSCAEPKTAMFGSSTTTEKAADPPELKDTAPWLSGGTPAMSTPELDDPPAGNGNGIASDDDEKREVSVFEWICAVHEDCLTLAKEIESGKVAKVDFKARIMHHGVEMNALAKFVRQTWEEYLESRDCWQLLAPQHLSSKLETSMNTSRQGEMRVMNARLLGVDPSVLLTPGAAIDNSSEIQRKYFEPLLAYLKNAMPMLQHRELIVILGWGKWRVLYSPGTIFLRQGEYPQHVGVVLNGFLTTSTEDQFTKNPILTHVIRKNELVGSEDYIVKKGQMKTARRTIQVPTHEILESAPPGMVSASEIQQQYGNQSPEAANLKWWQLDRTDLVELGLDIDEDVMEKWTEAVRLHEEAVQNPDSAGRDQWYDEAPQLSRPTVMYVWDTEDLERLMSADPRVYQALSTMLGVDLSNKTVHAAPNSLGSFYCGMRTQATPDNAVDAGFCDSAPELVEVDVSDIADLSETPQNA